MTVRVTQPLRVVLAGTVPALALVALLRAGALGDVGFQVALTVLLLVGSGLVLVRGVLRASSRRGWLALGAALAAGMTGNALTGWAEIGLHVPDALGVALGAAAFALSILGVAFMLADRPSRLPLGAALDGMTGALVAQAVIALILLAPVKDALQDGFDVVVLLYPLGDVLLMGLVAASSRRPRRLAPGLLVREPRRARRDDDRRLRRARQSILGEHVHGGAADMGWLVGTWLLVAAAWSPAPRRAPERWVRSAVPVVLGTAALVLLVGIAFSAHPLIPALACATGALAVVIVRLAITLHDNDRMLRLARIDSVTDALTGLGNRRRLMADLEDELGTPRGHPAALALFDLNGFKDYNDTFGHPAGDALLARLGVQPRARRSPAAARVPAWAATSSACSSARPARARCDRRARRARAAEHGEGFTVTAARTAWSRCPTTRRTPARRCASPTCACTRTRRAAALGRAGGCAPGAPARDRGARRARTCTASVAGARVVLARRLGLSETRSTRSGSAPCCTTSASSRSPTRSWTSRVRSIAYEWEFMRRHTLIGRAHPRGGSGAARRRRARALEPRALWTAGLPGRPAPGRRSRSARGSSPSATRSTR